jgi:hypothetical protein
MAQYTYISQSSSQDVNDVIFRCIDYADWNALTTFPCKKGSRILVLDNNGTVGNHVMFTKKNDTDHSLATGWIQENNTSVQKSILYASSL